MGVFRLLQYAAAARSLFFKALKFCPAGQMVRWLVIVRSQRRQNAQVRRQHSSVQLLSLSGLFYCPCDEAMRACLTAASNAGPSKGFRKKP
jgi:hypothetical protein